jgi:hypothetical protein
VLARLSGSVLFRAALDVARGMLGLSDAPGEPN